MQVPLNSFTSHCKLNKKKRLFYYGFKVKTKNKYVQIEWHVVAMLGGKFQIKFLEIFLRFLGSFL